MTELVQEGLHLAQREQRRLLVGRLCEVHHHAHVRTNVHTLAVYPLTLKLCHPGSALLALARMEVGVEHGKERTVLVEHLVSLHVRMVHLNVRALLERDAVETRSQAEHAVDNLRQLEVGT